MSEKLTRRDFLKLATVGAATTAVITGCGPDNRQEGSVTFSHELTDCVASFDTDGFDATRLRYGLPEMRGYDIKLVDSNPKVKPQIDPSNPNWVSVTIGPEGGRDLIKVDVGILEEGFGLEAIQAGKIDPIRSVYATYGFIAGYARLAVERGEIDKEIASQTVNAYFGRANLMQEEPFILIAGDLPPVSPTMPLING